jgi:hypothetical protein
MASVKIIKRLEYLDTIIKCLNDDLENNIIIYDQWEVELFELRDERRILRECI